MSIKDYQSVDFRIRDTIAALASRPGMSFEVVAKRLGMSERTLRSKRTKPDTFTLLELRRLVELAWRNGIIINII
jgi:hypothetical protein